MVVGMCHPSTPLYNHNENNLLPPGTPYEAHGYAYEGVNFYGEAGVQEGYGQCKLQRQSSRHLDESLSRHPALYQQHMVKNTIHHNGTQQLPLITISGIPTTPHMMLRGNNARFMGHRTYGAGGSQHRFPVRYVKMPRNLNASLPAGEYWDDSGMPR